MKSGLLCTLATVLCFFGGIEAWAGVKVGTLAKPELKRDEYTLPAGKASHVISEFIKEVPTVWDETKVPLAEPNRHVVIARRHGDTWYVGAIGNSQPQDIAASLNFLEDGEYEMTLFSDSNKTDSNPNLLKKTIRTAHAGESISLHLAAEGGAAMIIKPVEK